MAESSKSPVDTFLISGSRADDIAYLALADLAEVLGGTAESGVIGGHMVAALCARFPSPGFVHRSTGDADGGIPIALASTGETHDRLVELGYAPTNSNRYERPYEGGEDETLVIDLLVPTVTGRFGVDTHGGRQFDAMPGLGVAMAISIRLSVSATLSDGTERLFSINVPGVEGAVILKTYAWAGRRAKKDAIDLHSLFRIAEHHAADTFGGWRLDENPPQGSRRDTSRTLHTLADNWEAHRPDVAFDHRQLISSIRRRVSRLDF
jgi:hypothetical protein